MNTQIIAIANQKGGVGKTTTCANLGIGLAQAGKKVLLIDGDPQGSLTISLGNPQPDKLPFTLSDAMGKILMDQPIRPGEGILHHAEGVDLMPADIQLSGMEVSLVNAMSRETILRQYLDTLKGQYSHILIDCQPSLGMLTVNALAAANRIIIPVQAEYLPAKGLEQLLSTVSKVKRQINPKLQIDGILLTMVDNRTNFAKEIAALLRDTYGSKIKVFEWMPFERVQFRQRDFFYFFSLSIGTALLRRKQIIYRCQLYFFRAAFQVSTPPSSDFDTPLPPCRQGHGQKCFFPRR